MHANPCLIYMNDLMFMRPFTAVVFVDTTPVEWILSLLKET